MRLLATGDWHIGAGADLGRAPGDRLRDQADVCQQIASFAGEHDVDGVLLAGDLLNGPAAAPEHLAVLADFVHACPCPVLAITGNGVHDLAMRDTHGLAIFDHIPGIEVHSRPGWVEFAGCAVATLPWVSPARLIARHGSTVARDEIHQQTAELLVEVARDLADTIATMPLSQRLPRVLLAHWSVSGSALPNGLPVDQLREPVIPIGDLEELGFDAIVLGHIHQEQLLATDLADPVIPIFYVGSPLPLNFGEQHSRHGVWILEFRDGDPVRVSIPEFVPIRSRAFVTIDEHLADHDQYGLEVACTGAEVADAIVRIRLTGTAADLRGFDLAALRKAVTLAGAHVVRVQPEIVRAERARVAGLDEQVGELDALAQWIAAEGVDALADALRARTRGYLEAATA